MYPIYKRMVNAFALKALTKMPLDPIANLGVADDEHLESVPLVIFTEQHLEAQRPLVVNPYSQPYEKTVEKGAGDTLTMDDFVTDDFDIGTPYAGY